MVSGSQINLAEEFGLSQLVKQIVDSGQRILVLDGQGVQRSVVDA
jgi:hypothetical protein